MTNRITLLGTKGGPAVRQGGSMPTASLIEIGGKKILIDAAIGCTRSLVEAGHSLLEIDAIFITHLHSDHILELGPLLYTAWTTGLRQPVQVFGPKGTAAHWQYFLKAMSFDAEIRVEDEGRTPIAGLAEVTEFGDGLDTQQGEVRVRSLRVDHPPVTDCFALRFDHGETSAVFSADTCYFPPLADFAAHANVLVHEAMHLDGIEKLLARTRNTDERLRKHLLASHTPAEDVGRIADDAGVGHLLLNHLVPADDSEITEQHWLAETQKHWSGPTTVGHDGLTYDF